MTRGWGWGWPIVLVAGFAAAYVCDVVVRRERAAAQARAYADSVGKPMLNVGAGTLRTALFGPTTYGDVNCDIGAFDDCSVRPANCHCDVTSLPFPDKHFGSVLASHVVEHVEDYGKALAELDRVADRVFVITPEWWDPVTWLYWDHKWFFPDGRGGGMPVRLWGPGNL